MRRFALIGLSLVVSHLALSNEHLDSLLQQCRAHIDKEEYTLAEHWGQLLLKEAIQEASDFYTIKGYFVMGYYRDLQGDYKKVLRKGEW